MKQLIIPLLLFIFTTNSQAQWSGDTSHYIIFSDSLQLNDTANGTSYLSTPSDIINNAVWEFSVSIKQGTSSSNFAQVYLVSSTDNLDGDGYYVNIGNTADEVSLYRQQGSNQELIIDGLDKRIDYKPTIVRVKVTRSTNGLWELFTKINTASEYVLEGTAQDNIYYYTAYFGVKATYTSTRADETAFYDISISGDSFVDLVPPHIDSVNILTHNTAQFYVNEPFISNLVQYDQSDATTIILSDDNLLVTFQDDFIEYDTSIIYINLSDTSGNVLDTSINQTYIPFIVEQVSIKDTTTVYITFNKVPSSILNSNININHEAPKNITISGTQCIVSLNTPLINKSKVLVEISEILDSNGDVLKMFSEEIDFINPSFGDIVFNELMIDPTPVVYNLPEVEFIELFNPSEFNIDLTAWNIHKDDNIYTFPNYTITANTHVIIGSEAAINLFPDSIPKLALTSFPTLNNTEMTLELRDQDDQLIDLISYTNSWHIDDFKKAGGFSLERIDAYNITWQNNWISSCSTTGATPGRQNCSHAENIDTEAPYITHIDIIDSTTITIFYSEPLWQAELENTDYYQFSNQLIIDSIIAKNTDISMEVDLILSTSLDRNIVYQLLIQGINDLNMNVIESSQISLALCDYPEYNNIVINEIMFSPLTGYPEYIELYNNTNYPFDLENLLLTQKDDDDGWETGKTISLYNHLLLPQSYLVLSNNAALLTEQYDINDKLVIDVSLPSLPNTTGDIALMTTNYELIDHVIYDEIWHSTLLSDTKGVAIERISANNNSNTADNWFSASALTNYGTPGALNSHAQTEQSENTTIHISPEVFTPDGDGNEDFTTIYFGPEHEGASARVLIFNRRGQRIKELVNNSLIGNSASVRWTGTKDDSSRAPLGPYLVWIELVLPSGEVIQEKIDIVVSARVE